MIPIEDINDERISLYKSLRFTPKSHTDAKLFVAEGEKVVLKLLKSTLETVSIFAVSEFYDTQHYLSYFRKISPENLFTADLNLMNQIVGFRIHSGVMALGKIPDDTAISSLEDKIIILNGIVDAENVGAIVRNCAAFGFNSLIADESSSSPYLRRAVRVSMGNVFDMKLNHCRDLKSTISVLAKNGYRIIAGEICGNSVPLDKADFGDKYCIIFGSEGKGINQDILNLCDTIVHIPISDKVPSINVAASSAVFMHYLQNQSS